MRTTLAIDDSVLEEAKKTAESRGITLGELVTDTLRAALRNKGAQSATPYRAVTWGKPGDLVTDAAAISNLLMDDDDAIRQAPLRKRKARKATR